MSSQLKSIDQVFSETWGLFKQRAIPILLVLLLTTVVVILVFLACAAVMFFAVGGMDLINSKPQGVDDLLQALPFGPVVMVGVGSALFLFMIIFGLWSQAATFVVTVDESHGVKSALGAGWKYVFPMLWVGSLYAGIIMMGFLFFIVPSVFLGLACCFCYYIMIAEERSGIDAVVVSYLYMRGHWWNVFFKFLLVWMVSILLGLIPILGQILSLLFTPFLMLFMVVVYRDLKEVAGEVDPASSKRGLWLLMALAGMLFPLFGLLGAVVTIGPKFPQVLEQMQNQQMQQVPGTDEVPQVPIPTLEEAAPVEETSAPEVETVTSVDGFIVWRDHDNDAGNPLLEVKEVTARGMTDLLQLTVTLANPLEDYFSAAVSLSFDPVIKFYMDTDTDTATGSAPFGGQSRSGYDLEVNVVLVATGTGDGYVQVSLTQLLEDGKQSMGSLDDAAVSISGKTVKIRLPYPLIKVEDRDVVRVCYREAGQKLEGAVSKDQTVPLHHGAAESESIKGGL